MAVQQIPAMQYNFLGKSGLKVSNVCLGTATFGFTESTPLNTKTQADEKLAHALMDRFVEFGGNFIDTANIYSLGKSEEIVGLWMQKQERDRIVLATKARHSMDQSNPNKAGLSRRHLIEACNESLKRLKTDYIDLYQLHAWDAGTPLPETLRTLDDLVRYGKIRYFGLSNMCGWQVQKIVCLCESMGLHKVVSLQQQYNLLTRNSELEEFQVCENEGICVLPWSPLKGGFLTEKYRRGEVPISTDGRIGHLTATKHPIGRSLGQAWECHGNDDSYWHLRELMATVACNHGKTVSQVALRWLIQKEAVASVIIGVTSIKQLDENIGAASGWELTDEDMKQLDDASPIKADYPYGMMKAVNADRLNKYL